MAPGFALQGPKLFGGRGGLKTWKGRWIAGRILKAKFLAPEASRKYLVSFERIWKFGVSWKKIWKTGGGGYRTTCCVWEEIQVSCRGGGTGRLRNYIFYRTYKGSLTKLGKFLEVSLPRWGHAPCSHLVPPLFVRVCFQERYNQNYVMFNPTLQWLLSNLI